MSLPLAYSVRRYNPHSCRFFFLLTVLLYHSSRLLSRWNYPQSRNQFRVFRPTGPNSPQVRQSCRIVHKSRESLKNLTIALISRVTLVTLMAQVSVTKFYFLKNFMYRESLRNLTNGEIMSHMSHLSHLYEGC